MSVISLLPVIVFFIILQVPVKKITVFLCANIRTFVEDNIFRKSHSAPF